MIVLNSFTEYIVYKLFKNVTIFAASDSLHIYPILIDKPNAKS